MTTETTLSRISRTLTLIGALAVLVAIWQVTLAEKPPQPAEPSSPRALTTTETLGGADRYLTHLSTDKPIYRPGEVVYMRGVILHHATHKPLAQAGASAALVEIKGPKGDVAASGYVTPEESVLGYSWTIPEGQAGGEYTVHVTHPWTGMPPAERKFDIRVYRAPRLRTQIRFLRDGYGPGDDVVAMLEAKRAEGGVPAGAPVTVIARVDGEEAFRGPAEIDTKGNCEARFKLPASIRRGEGTLALVIEDGGVVETASKTIPILLQTVDLTLYPEGGDLVAGVPNRVYFEAFTPAHKPADLAGVVVDGQQHEVAQFRSEHEGRGRFVFTPEADGNYQLKITEPAGITTTYPLPEVKAQGVVLSAARDVTEARQPVELSLASPADGPYTVTLNKREAEVASASVTLAKGVVQQVRLDPGEADGVLTATVWDSRNKPVAERLIFRRPAESIRVKIMADSSQYVPGAKAGLTVETTDSSGKPVSAVVGLTVTDDSVLEMIEKREQAPRLPVMVLLEDDVKELADAHVYLDPDNADAPRAVDLLLGTQGWRRFAMVDAAAFIAQHGDQARRAIALRMESTKRVEELRDQGGAMWMMEGMPVPQAAAAPPAPGMPMRADPQAVAPPADAPVGSEDAAQIPAEPAVAAPEPPAVIGQPGPMAEAAAMPAEVPMDRERKKLDEALEQAGKRQADRLIAAKEAEAVRNDFVPVRVYAHQVRPNRRPGERVDFAETLYWHAGLRTDAQNGQARVEFGLNDSVTSFRVFADAFSAAGSLGAASSEVESVEPFYLEPKMPLEVASGDRILLPVALVNATDSSLSPCNVRIDTHDALRVERSIATFAFKPNQRLRGVVGLKVGAHNGPAEVTLSADAGPYANRVTRSVSVKPRGFPVEKGFGGMLSAGGAAEHAIEIPADLVAGSLTSRAVVYPTPLANLTEALARLIQEPYGCFEQTSSTTYPLVMAQQYFQSHTGVDPAVVRQAGETLARGYERLVGFECKQKGYEWFAEDPGHEALTAYGLLEFVDMSDVHSVDRAMIDRTRTWLLDRRDGKGGFTRQRRALHTWIEDLDCSNAYITWALLETGEASEGLRREVDWVRAAAEKSDNTYVVALGANVLALAGDKDGANRLLDRLSGKQAADGSLDGATTSIVGSGGESLVVETTALGMLAWLKNPRYADHVEKAMRYLAEVCKAGRYGSTQSSVLALKAIVEYDKFRARPKAPGSLQLVIDGRAAGKPVQFTVDDQGAIELPDLTPWLSPGKHTIRVAMEGGSEMPYSLAVKFHSLKPATSELCKVHLEVKLQDAQMREGDVTEARVAVVNSSNEPVPTPVAIVGIPGGLEVRHDQLKELVKSHKIDAYEVLGRDVVLYWRSLAAEQRVELPISLVAAIPGSYEGPASRTYLYYTDEFKHWIDPLRVEIAPKSPAGKRK